MINRIILAIVFLCCMMTAMAQTRVMVVSDLHICTDATPTTNYRLNDQSKDIFDKALDVVYQAKPDLLVVVGDISDNCDDGVHSHVISMLTELESAGVPVVVVPGSNDVAEGYDFATKYGSFGYASDTNLENKATNGLSWVGSLVGKDLGLVALAESSSVDWANTQIANLQNLGKNVVVITPKPIVSHYNGQTDLMDVSGLSSGVRYVVCGNGIVQNTVTENDLTEIATGSLTVYPCWMQMLAIDASGSISTTSTMVQMSVEKSNTKYDIQELSSDLLTNLSEACKSAIGESVSNADYELFDGTEVALYDDSESGRMAFKSLRYTRTFNNKQWQPLFVPFDLAYDDWKDCWDVAIPVNGDENKVTISYVEDGVLSANTIALVSLKPDMPVGRYSIVASKANGAGKYELKPDYEAEDTSVDSYSLHGTYRGLKGYEMWNDGSPFYALANGYLKTVAQNSSEKVYLKPMRWYLYTHSAGASSQFKVVVNDDDLTHIADVEEKAHCDGAIYNLQGQRVYGPVLAKGIYVCDGKKFIVK